MLKDLIVYSSKNGTTKETVEKIKASVTKDIDIVDLNIKTSVDLKQYDRIFIGAGIYASHLQNKVVKFIKANGNALKTKKVMFFIHGIVSEANYKGAIESAVKNILNSGSYESYYLGGKLDINKQNFIVKKMLTVISKQANIDPNNANTLNEKKIEELIKCISL